ncbi:YiiX/YebB-like N1pC/P60 family cysteine hydrolase [Acidovorax sp. SUPP3334]|uniref:YiiX/YebB-like N1pC/P60 family cysteine hydrolase n=1 Tax=Acidovorax sp. SUPP3334 TaxID=2920881 RepID=UPI0023DE4FD2|nr:YiiX/YebB-like N1pC/P60 family cysteine hydrolase [Acidovorax sp. SUPP3334]GKT25875.1 hypothetical protein AVHM3334_19345 [Acidovorax sp. SUPP3334]
MPTSKMKARGFDVDRVQLGDIVLTTTRKLKSLLIQVGVRADISHAMLCVGHASVIDSTPEGVQARNLARIVIEAGCSAYVLRPKKPLSADQLNAVITYTRGHVGARYSIGNAVKSLGLKVAPGRRQFCSRLVAQAYESAGVYLSQKPAFCTPGDLLRCELLAPVFDAMFEPSTEEEAVRREADPVKEMRDATNALLDGARKVVPCIESLNDIDAHLIEHPQDNARMVEAIHASGYLELWRTQVARTPWHYDVDQLIAHHVPESAAQDYCADVVEEEVRNPNHYAPMRSAYMLYHMRYPLEYFRLKVELYTVLAKNHAQRLRVAITFLERKGLLTAEYKPPVVPHTLEWYLSLAEWDPRLSLKVAQAVQAAGENTAICTMCSKEPTRDYIAASPPPAGPGTYRLCDECYISHSTEESLKPISAN